MKNSIALLLVFLFVGCGTIRGPRAKSATVNKIDSIFTGMRVENRTMVLSWKAEEGKAYRLFWAKSLTLDPIWKFVHEFDGEGKYINYRHNYSDGDKMGFYKMRIIEN